MAYGALNLKPWEFFALTPNEFNELIEGWCWRQDRDADTQATWVATLLNGAGHLKRRINPADLLGRPIGYHARTREE